MRRTTLLLAALILCARPSFAREFKIDGRTFVLPDGFTIERVAGPPLVDRPIVADFDEQGRLYVADSSGSNDDLRKQLKEKPHRVVRLEDADGDGRFDRRTIFADRMMFPAGTMWMGGSLYVSAPPSIWKLTDADGDGVAESRVEWFEGKTLTGCANDLHGPYLGPDGWIYWCKGAFARQTYERPGRSPFSTRAAHIFRARPDGTGIEPVMTGGMDNPVDVVFTPGGDRIFTTTFLQHPAGGQRDGLIHAIPGALYGKVHDVLDEHPRTSPEVMPALTHLGPAAPCGMTRYESDVLDPTFKDNLFVCQFNLRKVSRHVVIPHGSTFVTEDHDFLISPDQDFHPTDVLEDADGSLLVVDTGGWYKLCCPTSQIEKPDVLGAIYRIRRVDSARVLDPRGLGQGWLSLSDAALAERLNDARPAVRRRAVAMLAGRGVAALPTLDRVARGSDSTEARINALWAATRIDGDEARAIARAGLNHPVSQIRQVALHSISLHRDAKAVPKLIEVLDARTPEMEKAGRLEPRPPIVQSLLMHNLRAAAEALGRIGDRAAVPAILDTLAGPTDRVLDHSLTYALIEIGDPTATSRGLTRPEPAVRRAALIALEQMRNGGLQAGPVAAELASSNRSLRATAAWVLGRHPEWGATLAAVTGERLRSRTLTEVERSEIERQLAGFARSREIQDLLTSTLLDPKSPIEAKRSALAAIAGARLKEAPTAWISGLNDVLSVADSDLVARAVAAIRSLGLKSDRAGSIAPGLRTVAVRPGLPIAVRLEALSAVPGGLTTVPADLFALLIAELGPDRPVATRLVAAEVFGAARLSTEQRLTLADLLAGAGPLEVDRLLAAFDGVEDESVGLRLVAALERSPSFSSLRMDMIKPRLAKATPEVRRRAESLYSRLNADAAMQKARIDELTTTLPLGDVRRGQAVFNGSKAACLTCHAVGYIGGTIGPDLTRIGQIRAERDLIEAIVYPSASFVRSYEPIVIATKEGKSLNGLIRKESSDELVLATGPNQEVRVPRAQVEEIRPGTVSVMPAGLDQQLTRQELADLLAFLKSRK